LCILAFSAISPVAYHFIPQVASGDVFGAEVEISIRLVDSQSNKEQLEGKIMPFVCLPCKLILFYLVSEINCSCFPRLGKASILHSLYKYLREHYDITCETSYHVLNQWFSQTEKRFMLRKQHDL